MPSPPLDLSNAITDHFFWNFYFLFYSHSRLPSPFSSPIYHRRFASINVEQFLANIPTLLSSNPNSSVIPDVSLRVITLALLASIDAPCCSRLLLLTILLYPFFHNLLAFQKNSRAAKCCVLKVSAHGLDTTAISLAYRTSMHTYS